MGELSDRTNDEEIGLAERAFYIGISYFLVIAYVPLRTLVSIEERRCKTALDDGSISNGFYKFHQDSSTKDIMMDYLQIATRFFRAGYTGNRRMLV